MSETVVAEVRESAVEESAAPPSHRSRVALLKRLADVVSLPASRINAFERSVTADLLVEILQDADPAERQKVAARLSNITEIPHVLLRLILRDSIEVAAPLLRDNKSIADYDLLDCIAHASVAHRLVIAGRKHVSEVLVEALVDIGEDAVIETLLRNETARFSHPSIMAVAMLTGERPKLAAGLLRRPELRPSHAYLLFWSVDGAARRTILQRFAVSRELLQEAAADVFALAAAEGWRDRLSRMALQFIERRQRNRAALALSPFASLEEAIDRTESAFDEAAMRQIAELAGVKPQTAEKIFADGAGEPIAILCKATGLPRSSLRALWRATGRAEQTESGAITESLENVLQVFDMVAVDRAQTVLRYWNWSIAAGSAAGQADESAQV